MQLSDMRNMVMANGFDPVQFGSSRVNQFLNDGLQLICSRVDYYADEATQDFNAVAGTTSYPFPNDVGRLRSLRDTGNVVSTTQTTSSDYTYPSPSLSSPITINIPVSSGGYHVLDNGTDYIINLPATNRADFLQIVGGRNIQIYGEGGTLTGTASNPNWCVYLGDQTGVVNGRTIEIKDVTIDVSAHVGMDGIGVDCPSAYVQLKNCRITGVNDTSAGLHADMVQGYSGAKEVRIDRFTGDSTYQGLTFIQGQTAINAIHLRRVNLTLNTNGTDTYTQVIYLQGSSGLCIPTTFDQVYINNTKTGQNAQNAIYPDGSATPHSDHDSGLGRVTFTNGALASEIAGFVLDGDPPGGDFATGLPGAPPISVFPSPAPGGGTPVELTAVSLRDIDRSSPQTGPPRFYAIDGAQVHLYPTPDNAYALELRYWKTPALLVSDNDVPSIPDRWHWLVWTYAVAQASKAEDDLQGGPAWMADFNNGLAMFAADMKFPSTDIPHVIDSMWEQGGRLGPRGWSLYGSSWWE